MAKTLIRFVFMLTLLFVSLIIELLKNRPGHLIQEGSSKNFVEENFFKIFSKFVYGFSYRNPLQMKR